MHRPRNAFALDRRRFLTGAVASASVLQWSSVNAQEAAPTPVPIRIQTPDIAFVDALQQQLSAYQATAEADDGLLLSIVPAEPASDSLLNDLRLNGRRFSGAFVPYWLIPDLVRDSFIAPASPPPAPLPLAIAQLRSFGGEWIAADFDHDCDLLFVRRDRLDTTDASRFETWLDLNDAIESGGVSIAIPQTHAQQAVDHFCAMAASFVGRDDFWFDVSTMEPAIASPAHTEALSTWKTLSTATPASLRSGSTGDLWQSFVDGSLAVLVGSASFLPFALEWGVDPAAIAVLPLPGMRDESGALRRVGNTTGANWGGVTIEGAESADSVSQFLNTLASSEAQTAFATDLASGITPAPVAAELNLSAFEDAGWPSRIADEWLDAMRSTFENAAQLPPLRIAETRRYLDALESRIVTYLAQEGGSARESLLGAAADWNAINDAIGVETQRDLLSRSLMPPPVQ